MASIRRLDPNDPKSKWVVEYTDAGGARRRKTPKSGLKRDAEAWKQKIERELGDQIHTPEKDSATVGQVCKEYLAHTEQRRKDGRISENYRLKVDLCLRLHVMPHLSTITFSKLSHRDLEGWERDLIAKPRCGVTYRLGIAEIFRTVEEYAIRRGYTKVRTVAAFKRESGAARRPAIRTFTIDDVKKLLATADIRHKRQQGRMHALIRCSVYLAAYCGLRKGEIYGLTLDNVDLDRNVLRIRHSLTFTDELKGPKTASGKRDVPMPAVVAELLRGWISDHYIANARKILFRSDGRRAPCHGYSVPTDGGRGAMEAHYDHWLKLLGRAGFELKEWDNYHFHALRHFASSLMIESGLSLMDTASLLGHAKFDMTLQTYAHSIVGGSHRHDSMERLAGRLSAT